MIKAIREKKSFILGILVLLCCIFAAVPILAEGSGDSSGGGKSVPLGLVSSSPSDGQRDVSLTGDINLSFNKNVIYLLIRDANKKCFSLSSANGSKVPIDVIMADDQTPEGFEQRRNISIRPLQSLQPGTGYVVRISSQLQAKNGMTLEQEAMVHFTTAGAASKPAETEKPTAPSSAGNNITTVKSNSSTGEKVENKTDVKADTSDKVNSAEEKVPVTGTDKKDNPFSPIIIIVVIIILAVGCGVYLKKKK